MAFDSDNMKRHIRNKRASDEAAKLIEQLFSMLNHEDQASVMQGVTDGLMRAHPTLRQDFMREFVGQTLPAMRDRPGDLRDQDTRQWVDKALEATADHYFSPV